MSQLRSRTRPRSGRELRIEVEPDFRPVAGGADALSRLANAILSLEDESPPDFPARPPEVPE